MCRQVTRLPIAVLVLDYDLYPRVQVDPQHASYLASALRAGTTLPPVVIDAASKRVIDGFHRIRATRAVYGDEATIDCELREFASEGDMFAEAMRLNASHGRALTKFDRARCLLHAKKFRLGVQAIAQVLQMRPEELKALAEGRVARLNGEQVPIKRTIKHMAGQQLTAEQVKVNSRLSGREQLAIVNELIALLDSGLVNWQNEALVERLHVLHEKLDTALTAPAGPRAEADPPRE